MRKEAGVTHRQRGDFSSRCKHFQTIYRLTHTNKKTLKKEISVPWSFLFWPNSQILLIWSPRPEHTISIAYCCFPLLQTKQGDSTSVCKVGSRATKSHLSLPACHTSVLEEAGMSFDSSSDCPCACAVSYEGDATTPNRHRTLRLTGRQCSNIWY